MILAAFIVGGCLVATPYAWAMLRGRRTRYHRVGLLLPLTVAMLAAPMQIVVGDWAARHVAENQPTKLAAMEGLYAHRRRARRSTSVASTSTARSRAGSASPTCCRSSRSTIRTRWCRDSTRCRAADRPPVNVVRTAFQLMVAIGSAMLGLGLWLLAGVAPTAQRSPLAVVPARRGARRARRRCSRSSAGGSSTEVGRQPWIV